MNSLVLPTETRMPDGYLEGARACLAYLGVKAGEQVLLLPTFDLLEADPATVYALRQVASELGAETTVTVIESLGTRGEPTRALARAIERCDVFTGIGNRTPNPITGHCRGALTARWDFGSRQVDLRGGPGVLASQCSLFPTEIVLAIARQIHRHLKPGGTLRISDADGTDLRLSFRPGEVFFGGSFEADTFGAGQRVDWPLGQIMLHVEEDAEGVFATRYIKGMKALLDVPVRGEVRQGRYRPEPGPHTDAIIEKMAEPQNSDIVSKLFIGINPKGSVTEGLTRSNIGNMPQAAGVTSLAVGDKAGYIASVFQTAAYFLAPTLHANGELICRDGRFLALDSPEIRSIAARYGDPDQLLSQLP